MGYLFRLFTSNETFCKKVSELENKNSELEANMRSVKDEIKSHQESSEVPDKESPPTIKIEHL